MSLNGDYSIFERSMNGIKTLSDGISTITDGVATHDKIFYTDEIQSSPDGQTTIGQTSITTIDVFCDTLTADETDVINMNANIIDTLRLRINDVSNNIIYDLNGNNLTATFNGVSNFNNTVTLTNTNFTQTQTGEINQSGTGVNDLKDTNINGFLVVGSNITQNGGSTSLKDVTCDNLTMRSGKSITQSGNAVSNTLSGTTTTKDLVILNSVVFPANVTVPGTTTTDDIIMDGSSVIIQDLTVEPSGKTNIFRNSKTLNLEVDGNLDMIEAGSTATLKNTIIQGTAQIQGDITQTTGATVLKTISCNNITLNADQLITMSGTGFITQSGTGTNTLKAITLTNNSNLTFNGNGIISQPLNTSQNVFNNFRCAGYGIIGGRNNTIFSNTQNIQNNNGLQLQFNRDNSSQYSFIMNNRGLGGNGGFRFQRYIGGVYLDEPLTIDDNITMNKNLSIPAGSLSCATATLGNISQTELNCLDNCNQNINNKFTALDSQIANLQSSSQGNTTALTGISYTSATDTTLIDNNLTISDGKTLKVGTQNIVVDLNANTSNVSTLLTRTSGMSYASATDTTTFNNNLLVGFGKKLFIGDMDVGAEITALETSFTTGTIDATNIEATNITVGVLNVNFATNTDDLTVTGLTNLKATSITTSNGTTTNASLNITDNGNSNRSLIVIPNSASGAFNPTVQTGDISIVGLGTSNGVNGNLNISAWSNTQNGCRITNNSTTITGGSNYVSVNSNDGTTINGNTIIHGDLTIDNTIQAVEIPLPIYTYSKIYGTSNVLVATITVDKNFKKPIVMNIPISVYRNGTTIILPPANAQKTETLTSISAYYTITNLQNATSLTITTNNTLPISKTYTYSNSSFNYEQYFTNVSLTIPAYTLPSNANLEYKVYFNFTASMAGNFQDGGGTVNGYYVNTDVSDKTGNVNFLSPSGSNYSSTSFTIQYTSAVYLPNTPSEVKTSTLISNNQINQFNIQTNSINASTANISNIANITNANISNGNANLNTLGIVNGYASGAFRCKNFIAGYFINTLPYQLFPVFCSLNRLSPNNDDDGWIINPGYKFLIYDSTFYLGDLIQTVENTSDNPQFYAAPTFNKASSIKVYFRPTNSSPYEIIALPTISFDFNGNLPT